MAVDMTLVWLPLCTLLVLLMQAGFACFEAGLVRRKNAINVAMKNVADLMICILLFLAIGYPLMFGANTLIPGGLLGWGASPIFSDDPTLMLQGLFQAMFAGTCITIVSGIVAERTMFRGYLWLAAGMVVLVYPISGYWAWGPEGWLASLGFVDYAGSTVVHLVGGAIGLVAAHHIGPRFGRFDGAAHMEPSSLTFSSLGAFILMFGWFGFNAGAATDFENEVPRIMFNTGLGAAAGILVGLIASRVMDKNIRSESVLGAMLAGLVGVTAGCFALTPWGAVIMGGLGALGAMGAIRLLEKWQIDDPVAGVPVHFVAGAIGTILYPLFSYETAMPEHFAIRFDWVGVQALGVVAIGGFALAVAYVYMKITSQFVVYRVSERDEILGLNVAEHGAGSSLSDILEQMHRQADNDDYRSPIYADNANDAYHLAFLYNRLRERFNSKSEQARKLYEDAIYLANHDTLTGLANRRALFESAERAQNDLKRHGDTTALAVIDVDDFKKVNEAFTFDVGDMVLQEIAQRLADACRENDVVARFSSDTFVLLLQRADQEALQEVLDRYQRSITLSPIRVGEHAISLTVSYGATLIQEETRIDVTLQGAYDALYAAQQGGGNQGLILTRNVRDKAKRA